MNSQVNIRYDDDETLCHHSTAVRDLGLIALYLAGSEMLRRRSSVILSLDLLQLSRIGQILAQHRRLKDSRLQDPSTQRRYRLTRAFRHFKSNSTCRNQVKL